MVGAKLRLKPIRRVAKWSRHHPRVGDNDVEELPLRQQLIRTFTHAFEASEIERNQLETSASSRSISSYVCRRGFRLFQVPPGTHHVCTMRCQRSCRLTAQT